MMPSLRVIRSLFLSGRVDELHHRGLIGSDEYRRIAAQANGLPHSAKRLDPEIRQLNKEGEVAHVVDDH